MKHTIINKPFLDCNIWSVNTTQQPYINDNFYLVERVYYYNSLDSGIVNFNLECIQIPEFEIQNSHLLSNLDYELINKQKIPILYRNNEIWKIDLTYYENYKLQFNII
jgi:hypothetical protein